MLENVLGEYLDGLAGREREFDTPFMALLRANKYSDIHFTHGQFEFGKDFLAKGFDRDGIWSQFLFQTKGGNIGLKDWHPIRGQIDQLRTNEIAHPSFDPQLPRRAVLVITGRLVGGAIPEAQQYRRHLQRLGELEFDLWDREDLIEKMSHNPTVSFAGSTETSFLKVIALIKERLITREILETHSRLWIKDFNSLNTVWQYAIEASIISRQLESVDRLDFCCLIGLCLIRAGWASTHGIVPPHEVSVSVADLGMRIFEHGALSIWERCNDETLNAWRFIYNDEGPSAFVTGSVRCSALLEILGLYGLSLIERGEKGRGAEIADFLEQFIDRIPPSARPISDKWAISLVAPMLLLAVNARRKKIQSFLSSVVRWTCDRYDSHGFDVGSPHASADEEIAYLLGGPFEHVPLSRRSSSYLATICLDLAAVMELGELYNDIRNDFQAVGADPLLIDAGDTMGQYVANSGAIKKESTYAYRENWSPSEPWKVAAHHERYSTNDFYLGRVGRIWELLGISSVVRDRHSVQSWRRIIEAWNI